MINFRGFDLFILTIVLHVSFGFQGSFPLRLLLSSNSIKNSTLWNQFERLESNTMNLLYIPTASLWIDPSITSKKGLIWRRQQADIKSKLKFAQLMKSFESKQIKLQGEIIDISDDTICFNEVVNCLRSTDCVYVDGGNTFFLAHHLRRTHFKEALQQCKRKLLYIGISAGAICAGKNISPALWKNWDQPIPEIDPTNIDDLYGMDLAGSCSFFPHFEAKWKELLSSKASSLNHQVVSLPEKQSQKTSSDISSEEYVECWTSLVEHG